MANKTNRYIYKGFHHLKISLARELVDAKDEGEISGHISVDDMEGSLRGILSNKMEELRQTVAMIDREELKRYWRRQRVAAQSPYQ